MRGWQEKTSKKMKAVGFIRESDKTCGKMSHVKAKLQCLTITHMAMFNENQTVTGQYKYHIVMTVHGGRADAWGHTAAIQELKLEHTGTHIRMVL